VIRRGRIQIGSWKLRRCSCDRARRTGKAAERSAYRTKPPLNGAFGRGVLQRGFWGPSFFGPIHDRLGQGGGETARLGNLLLRGVKIKKGGQNYGYGEDRVLLDVSSLPLGSDGFGRNGCGPVVVRPRAPSSHLGRARFLEDLRGSLVRENLREREAEINSKAGMETGVQSGGEYELGFEGDFQREPDDGAREGPSRNLIGSCG